MLYTKLKEENQKLWEKVFAMEKEIEDLKFQVSSSDVIISEYKSKIEELKAENKKLMSKISNNTSNVMILQLTHAFGISGKKWHKLVYLLP